MMTKQCEYEELELIMYQVIGFIKFSFVSSNPEIDDHFTLLNHFSNFVTNFVLLSNEYNLWDGQEAIVKFKA